MARIVLGNVRHVGALSLSALLFLSSVPVHASELDTTALESEVARTGPAWGSEASEPTVEAGDITETDVPITGEPLSAEEVATIATTSPLDDIELDSMAANAGGTYYSTGVPLGEGTLVEVSIDIDQTHRDKWIEQFRQLRAKAWDDRKLYYQKIWGFDKPMILQDYLKSIGLTRSQYINGVVWNQKAEKAALQRAVESCASFSHTRPNGQRTPYYENLAANSPAGDAIHGWTYAKRSFDGKSEYDHLIESGGKMTYFNGHMHALLNPDVKSMGLAFAGNCTVWVGDSTDTRPVQTGLNLKATRTVRFTVPDTVAQTSKISSFSSYLVPGASFTPKVTPVQVPTSFPVISTYNKIYPSLKWSSSNARVAQIPSDGSLLKANGAGSAIITAKPLAVNSLGKSIVLNRAMSRPITIVGTSDFTDVPTNHQFFSEITWLKRQGITTGYPDKTFRPLESVERGAVAAFFYRMAGSPAYTPPKVSPFKDIPTNHQFYKEIAWLSSKGITTGYPDGTFRPKDPVSRAAMAAFFYRMSGSPQFDNPSWPPFWDYTNRHQFAKEIAWLKETGITTGYPDRSFRPEEPISRAAMAAFLYRYKSLAS